MTISNGLVPASGGAQIYYATERGEGCPLVCLDEPFYIAVDSQLQTAPDREFMRALAAGAPWILFDWRGKGRSTSSSLPTFNDFVSDAETIVEMVGAPVDLYAWGRACTVAIGFAARHPSAVRRLLLTGATVNVRERRADRDFGHMAAFDRLTAFRNQLRGYYGEISEEDLDRLATEWDRGYPEQVRLAHNVIFRDLHLGGLVDGFGTDTLLLTNGTDREIQLKVQALLPGATIVDFENRRPTAVLGAEFRRLWDEFCPVAPPGPAPASNGTSALTVREREILAHIARGASNGDIAEELCLSTRTVERHARNIYTKLGVHNRAEATAYAVRNGLA